MREAPAHTRSRLALARRRACATFAGIFALLVSSAGSVATAQHAPRGETHWLGAEPHVPLVTVSGENINAVSWTGARIASADSAVCSVRGNACREWSRVGRDWTAVDRWGQRVGERRLVSREFYDVTGCYESSFPDDPADWNAPHAWPPAIVLYARGSWRPHASVEWEPSARIRDEHRRFIATLEHAVLPPDGAPDHFVLQEIPLLSIGERTMFFRVNDPGNPDEHIAPRERHFAVSGGMALILAERTDDGQWFARVVDNDLANERTTNRQAYLPLAVFDMNGDGWPEIVAHEREGGGEFYGDIVIARDANGSWSIVARSVGGSTA